MVAGIAPGNMDTERRGSGAKCTKMLASHELIVGCIRRARQMHGSAHLIGSLVALAVCHGCFAAARHQRASHVQLLSGLVLFQCDAVPAAA